jgi:hypothetical protein
MEGVERRFLTWSLGESASRAALGVVFALAGLTLLAYLWISRERGGDLGWTPHRVAEIVYADGPVRVRRADSNEFLSAGSGVALGDRDTVQVSDTSQAVIRYVDATTYRLAPATTVVVRGGLRPSVPANIKLAATSGRLASPSAFDSPFTNVEARQLEVATGRADVLRRRILIGHASDGGGTWRAS